MTQLPKRFLTRQQALSEYGFLTPNMLKNLLFKDVGGFRTKVIIKLGKRILIDEQALLAFLEGNKQGARV